MLALGELPNSMYFPSSRLYFIRLDKNGTSSRAGKPYCTICSKLALDLGVSKWVLFHNEGEFCGFYEYDAEEYNQISFGFREWELNSLKPQNL